MLLFQKILRTYYMNSSKSSIIVSHGTKKIGANVYKSRNFISSKNVDLSIRIIEVLCGKPP